VDIYIYIYIYVVVGIFSRPCIYFFSVSDDVWCIEFFSV